MKNTQCKIGFIGKLRVGKSALTNYAVTFYDFQPFAFGDELKRTFHDIFPQVKREPKPRELYQRYGTLMREIDTNVWLDATMRNIERYQSSKCACQDVRVLVEDVRQENEYLRLKAEGFTLIRITAPDDLRIKRAIESNDDFTVHDLAHPTELACDDFEVDAEIINDGSLIELYTKFDAMMAELGVEKRD